MRRGRKGGRGEGRQREEEGGERGEMREQERRDGWSKGDNRDEVGRKGREEQEGGRRSGGGGRRGLHPKTALGPLLHFFSICLTETLPFCFRNTSGTEHRNLYGGPFLQ